MPRKGRGQELTCACRVPYTVTKFVAFEKVSEAIFAQLDKEKLSSGAQTTVNLGSGLIAGFAAAIVSQPADTMLSKINKTKGLPGESTISRLVKIAGELGLRGSFAGLPTRLFMVGGLTAGQFAIYGDIKKALGKSPSPLGINSLLLVLKLTSRLPQVPPMVSRSPSKRIHHDCPERNFPTRFKNRRDHLASI